MHILITGAAGFIGFELAKYLLQQGHSVTGCVRSSVLRHHPSIRYVACDFSRDIAPEIWGERLEGVDVVINAVGLIHSRGKQNFDTVHFKAPLALFEACAQKKIKRVIQISALGVGEDASLAYHVTKQKLECALSQLDLDWVILRPSWLYSDASSKSVDFIQAYSILPILPLMAGGHDQLQPLWMHDFAQGMEKWVHADAPSRVILEVGGPEKLSFRQMLLEWREWFGLSNPLMISIPRWLVWWTTWLSDKTLYLPMNLPSLDMLRRQNVTDDTRFWQHVGFEPMPMRDVLTSFDAKSQSATLQRARFYFMPSFLRGLDNNLNRLIDLSSK